ncbi:ABC transporter ATP-binding protein [Halarcobacter ebronensis]|uniref:ABC transporter ATP-binding protein/permease n=1 Tax=Halarcobacter ebronensis TaxID=1462615 RepID=A0A4Q1AMM0_9BACT|nr:ABC transporter ATP-binding protein [Halarcobacter ebronensis]QKF82735.1 ABC transporter, ATP-binding/permease components [Halarcobacter ebronensis]RXK06760.1 ABC transporter ATP-binding protein/permease [Halarcobacter ebronensis]
MNQDKSISFKQSYKISLELAGKYSKLVKKSYMYYILSFIFQAIAFLLFYPLLNAIFAKEFSLENSLIWLSAIVVLSLISFIFKWLATNFQYSGDLVEVTHSLRVKLGKKIKSMPLQSLYKYRTGELNSTLAQNVDDSVLHMGIVAGMALETIVIPIVLVIGTFIIDFKMGIALLVAIPIAIPIYNWSRKKTKWEKEEGAKAHATLEADTIEYLQGLTVLRSINQIGENATTLKKSIVTVREVQKKGVIGSSLPMIIMNTLIEFIFLLILSLGALWVAKEELSFAALAALLIILGRLSEPLANFLAIAGVLDVMHAGFKNIKKIFDTEDFTIHKPILEPKKFNIDFDNVTFNYDDSDKKALEYLSLEIKQNSLTAIVGPSGSGKTTITKLIMRYADPQNGTIKIGDVDIRNMEQSKLMSYISVVFQDVYLFDDTILNNIRMGKPNANNAEVMLASKAAFCHEFISKLPKGYDTKIGEIGGSLSGGERQRISIARAILKDAPIVILDEPTSALDTQSEVAVQNALDELIKNKTVIVIAHRLSTIAHADNILVIEDGKLKERGTHIELMAKKEKYYSMVQAQERTKEWNSITKKKNE